MSKLAKKIKNVMVMRQKKKAFRRRHDATTIQKFNDKEIGDSVTNAVDNQFENGFNAVVAHLEDFLDLKENNLLDDGPVYIIDIACVLIKTGEEYAVYEQNDKIITMLNKDYVINITDPTLLVRGTVVLCSDINKLAISDGIKFHIL